MSASKTPVRHQSIRAWAEARGGRPSALRICGLGGIVRLDFGGKEQALDRIGWDEFFEIFDENARAFAYPDDTAENCFGRFIGWN